MTTRYLISKVASPFSQWEKNKVREIFSSGGMAGQFLKAATVSTEQAVEMMKLTKRQIEVTMFAAGADKLESLKVGKLIGLQSTSEKS